MSLNSFFIVVFIGLLSILFLFTPMNLKNIKHGEVPKLDIDIFTVHELDTQKLITFMNGTKAYIYDDRYEVLDVDYTDASQDYIANIRSKNGLYKDDIIDLKGDVVYTRVDGLTFESQSLVYNQKSGFAYTKDDYLLYQDKDIVEGTSLKYNNRSNKLHSKNVRAVYNMKER